jgi:hypothetical protein
MYCITEYCGAEYDGGSDEDPEEEKSRACFVDLKHLHLVEVPKIERDGSRITINIPFGNLELGVPQFRHVDDPHDGTLP